MKLKHFSRLMNLEYEEIATLILAPFIFFILGQYAFGANLLGYSFGEVFANYCIIAALQYLLLIISNHIKISVLLTGLIFYGFALANTYIYAFRGSPILPWDLASIGTALNVAGGYHFFLNANIVLASLIFAAYLLLSFKLLPKRHFFKKSLYPRLSFVFVMLIMVSFVMSPTKLEAMGVSYYAWKQGNAYRDHGIVAEFLLNMQFMNPEEPDDYSYEAVRTILSNNEESELIIENPSAPESPNIIAIMNESWADFEEFGNIELSEPVMENIKSLDNAIFGHAYSSVVGGGTSQIEYEFLSGNTQTFLPSGAVPYQQYIKTKTPSFVWHLKDLGYDTLAFHPYYGNGWNRNKVYDLIGFDAFISLENMHTEPVYGNQDFCIDSANYEELFYLYENKDPARPLFLFNVTMQNHGGYDTFERHDVEVVGHEGQYPKAEFYLSYINETDEAFMKVVDYFSKVEEPTIVIMYGDHQPWIEDEFVNMAMGVIDAEEPSQIINKYRVPYVIWANFELPEVELKDTSINYLMQEVLALAGLETNEYGNFLNNLYEYIPSLSLGGYFDSAGNYYSYDDKTAPYQDLIAQYKILEYANIFDVQDEVVTTIKDE